MKYEFKTIKELADMVRNRGLNKPISFTSDTPEGILFEALHEICDDMCE